MPKAFRHCLHRRALLVAPLLGGVRSEFFDTDRELLTNVARATTMAQVHEEIRDYRLSASRTGWLHRDAKVRVSAGRLIVLAEALHLGVKPMHTGENPD